MSLRQKMTLADVLGIAGLLLAVAGFYTDGGVPIALAGLAALCGGVCLMLRWKRCPYCGAFLGRGGLPGFCPGCGKKIDADAKRS